MWLHIERYVHIPMETGTRTSSSAAAEVSLHQWKWTFWKEVFAVEVSLLKKKLLCCRRSIRAEKGGSFATVETAGNGGLVEEVILPCQSLGRRRATLKPRYRPPPFKENGTKFWSLEVIACLFDIYTLTLRHTWEWTWSVPWNAPWRGSTVSRLQGKRLWLFWTGSFSLLLVQFMLEPRP